MVHRTPGGRSRLDTTEGNKHRRQDAGHEPRAGRVHVRTHVVHRQPEPAEGRGARFRVITYNIHRCRGLDGRSRPQRIIDVLREIDADVVALQEILSVEGKSREENQASFIAEELGLEYRVGETRKLNGGRYGNVVLSRMPFISVEKYDISHAGREERCCMRADLKFDADSILHVYNVHLGTAFLERRHQGRKLLEADILGREDFAGPRVLLGDFNEWTRGLTTRLLSEHFGSVDVRIPLGRRRTYPGLLPLLHLDHIYFDPQLILESASLHRSRKALIASDHLPIVADLLLPPCSLESGEGSSETLAATTFRQ